METLTRLTAHQRTDTSIHRVIPVRGLKDVIFDDADNGDIENEDYCSQEGRKKDEKDRLEEMCWFSAKLVDEFVSYGRLQGQDGAEEENKE